MEKKGVRPSLFIGSSTESVDYAYAIQENLEDNAEVTVWDQNIFELTKGTLESLVRAVGRSDFALFVFAPSDTARLRKHKYKTVRDNIIFELGLFMGKLGRDRTFIVVPKGISDFHLPTDLAGITSGQFDPKRKDKNLNAAFGPFCNRVRTQIRRKGKVTGNSRPNRANGRIDRRATLHIVRAFYGMDDQRLEVTKQLQKDVIANRLHILAGNQIAGDPYPNVRKKLTVEYLYNNEKHRRLIDEGEYLDLP